MIKTMQDRQPGLGTTGITGTLTITKTGTTARTATFPDAAIVVAGSAAALTSGRVPFVTTGGLLTDSTGLTYSINTLRVGTDIDSYSYHILNGAAAAQRGIYIRTASVERWRIESDVVAESGSDAGCGFRISARTDAGAGIDTPLSIVRAAGGAITLARPVTITGVITHSGSNTASGSTASRLAYFGGTSGDGAAFELRGSTYSGSPDTGFLRVGSTYVANWSTAGITLSTGTLTVPNGTAAAPGIRLASEASGLYRASATALGLSVAGVSQAVLDATGLYLVAGLDARLATVTEAATASGNVRVLRTGGTASDIYSAEAGHLVLAPRTSAARNVAIWNGETLAEIARFDSSGITTFSRTTDATTTSNGSVRLSGGLSVAANKAIYCGGSITSVGQLIAARVTTTGTAFAAQATTILSAGVTDCYGSGMGLYPAYDQAFTVTRHNYFQIANPVLTNSAAVTDACVFRFDAAIGSHKAIGSGTTKTSPGTVTAWVKININGTIHYMPAYASTTS